MGTLDFELEIGPGTADGYPLVARSPDGEVATSMRLPVTLAELSRRLVVIRAAVLASSAVVRRAPTADEEPVRELGRWLFEAALTGDVRGLYLASSQRARSDGATLRLVLRVRPPELARLPWEFLFDPERQDYLALSVPLVRYPEVLAPVQALRATLPLGILGMVARPRDQDPLAVDDEQQRLHEALAGMRRDGLVRLGWVTGQTYRDLEEALDGGPWHILHFVGHGGYDRGLDQGTLALADGAGDTDPLGADDLGRLLAEHHTLRLVLLNACHTGRSGASDAFSSTAGALMRRGVPAVVAMQFEITDLAAIRFAQAFYHYVAKRLPIDTSVMRARRALRLAKKDTLEWGTPVLYLHASDGRIFGAAPAPATSRAATAPATSPAPATSQQTAVGPIRRPVPCPLLQAVPVRAVSHDRAVNAVAFSPDDHRLATASDDRTARIWDATSGALLATLTHDTAVRGVAFSVNGRRLATASRGGTARIWDATSGARSPLADVTHHFLAGMALSPDGRRLATTSNDETARIWDLRSGRQLVALVHEGVVRGVAFSSDGRRLATAGADGVGWVWDVGSARRLAEFAHPRLWGAAFTRSGRLLVTVGADAVARVWELRSGRLLVALVHEGVVRGVAFSPDGRRLATASTDGTARVWDVRTGRRLVALAHRDAIRGVAFSSDGRRLATAGKDRTARIWALPEGHEGNDDE
jgi:hypothetical protein